MTITNQTGDGVNDDLIDTVVTLPDSGTNMLISGVIQAVGSASVPVTGSPLTIPAAPTAGNVFYNVQVDVNIGLATVQQSITADPPALVTTRVVFRQTLTPANVDPALAPESTPDSY